LFTSCDVKDYNFAVFCCKQLFASILILNQIKGLAMLKSDVIAYYGGVRAVAEALKLSTQAVTAWKTIIPEVNAWRIYSLTKGELTIDQALYA